MSTALDMSSDTVVPSDRPSATGEAVRATIAEIDEATERYNEVMALVAEAKEAKSVACFKLAALKGWTPGAKSPKFKFRHPSSGAILTLVVKKDRGGVKDHAFLRGQGDENVEEV